MVQSSLKHQIWLKIFSSFCLVVRYAFATTAATSVLDVDVFAVVVVVQFKHQSLFSTVP